MPDESGSIPSFAGDLETLVAEAEKSIVTPVTDHPKPCLHTFNSDTDTKCATCLWSFCMLCASSLDPKYCHLCLPLSAAELTQTPLVDVDGVTHDGRELKPAAGATFYSPRIDVNGVTLAKTISEMSILDLESYIDYYKHLVRQAETALDFRRVVLGTSQLELSQRKDTEQRKLRSDKTKYPVKTISFDKSGKQIAKPVSTAKLGDMLKMIEMLKQLKKQQDAKTKS